MPSSDDARERRSGPHYSTPEGQQDGTDRHRADDERDRAATHSRQTVEEYEGYDDDPSGYDRPSELIDSFHGCLMAPAGFNSNHGPGQSKGSSPGRRPVIES